MRLLCLLYMPNCATFYFCITWLPSYLENPHGFEKAAARRRSHRCRCCSSIGTQFFGGFISDVLTRRFGITVGRRAPGVVGYALAPPCASCWPASPTDPMTAAMFIALAAATCMLTTAPAWSTCVDIGREHSGTVSATMNTSGQFAAIDPAQPLAAIPSTGSTTGTCRSGC